MLPPGGNQPNPDVRQDTEQDKWLVLLINQWQKKDREKVKLFVIE